MEKTEGEIKKEIVQVLRKHGFLVWVQHANPPLKRKFQVKKGICDIIGIHRNGSGKMIALEVKKPGGRLSEEQIKFINKIRSLGGIAGVVYNVEDTEDLLNL